LAFCAQGGACPGRTRVAGAPQPTPAQEPQPAEGKNGSIEITFPNGARVSVDAFVNEKALSRVLRAMVGLA